MSRAIARNSKQDGTPRRRRTGTRAPSWSPEEDAQLLALAAPRSRRAFVPYNWPQIILAFPGRTKGALAQRLQDLRRAQGQLQRTHWTPEEDKALRAAWVESSKKTLLALFPRRSWNGIAQRATRDLGLPTRPQGWVELATEADLLNVSREFADTVVAWARAWAPVAQMFCELGHAMAAAYARHCPDFVPAEVPPDGYDGGAVPTRLHTTSHRNTTGARRRVLVEEGTFEPALERWLSWEDSPTAASRYDINCWLLLRWAKAGGWSSAHAYHATRFPPAWWDAITEGRAQRGGRSINAHATARGINPEVLRRVLIEAGVHTFRGRGRKVWLTDAQVNDALARTTIAVGAKRAAAAARKAVAA